MLGFFIFYFMGIVITLMLLSEFKAGRSGPFIIETNWAVGAALLWPLAVVAGILSGLWIVVGGAYQWFTKEGK